MSPRVTVLLMLVLCVLGRSACAFERLACQQQHSAPPSQAAFEHGAPAHDCERPAQPPCAESDSDCCHAAGIAGEATFARSAYEHSALIPFRMPGARMPVVRDFLRPPIHA